MNQSQYARHRGVSPAAVTKALKAGRITREPDGSINAVKADSQWRANTDASRVPAQSSRYETLGCGDDSNFSIDTEIEASSLIRRVLAEEGRPVVGSTSGADIRTAEVILRVRKLAQDLASSEREYIATAPLRKHIEEAFGALCDEIRALPDHCGEEIAAEVQCDPAAMHAALTGIVDQFIAGLFPPLLHISTERH